MSVVETSNSAVAGPSTEIEIKIGGAVYNDPEALTVRAEIETSLRMPAMATISFNDDHHHKKAKDFSLDAPIEIAVNAVGNDEKPIIFKGTVKAVEAHRQALRGVTVIRCFDELSMLYGPRKSKAFIQVTYGDLVRQIGGEYRIPIGTVVDGPKHDYVAQFEESDGEFLERLAAEYGFLLRLDEQWKLSFGPPPEIKKQTDLPTSARAGNKQLMLGDDLMNYEITFGPTPVASTVKATGWNSLAGEAASAEAEVTFEKKLFELKNLRANPGPGDFMVSSYPFLDVAFAEQTAKGVADEIAAGLATLRGRVMGNPFIAAGVELAVGPQENSFAGWYLVTSARQTYEDGHLRTELICNGLGDRPGGAGGNGVSSAASPAPRMPFAVTALVTDVKDNEGNSAGKMGRVKVKFPTLGWPDESDWLRVVMPGAGKKRGMWWLPEVDDEVLVVFDRGDFRSGYVLGGVHNGVSMPDEMFGEDPVAGDGRVLNQRALTTTLGHQLLFTDKSGEESIELHTADKKLVTKLDQKEGTITITADTSQAKVVMKCDGSIAIETAKTITVEAKGDALTLKGVNVNIEASSDVTVKGMNIKADAQMNFEGKGNAGSKIVSGANTLDAGPAGVTITGLPTVKINS